jgi:hypothetical protein
LFDESVDHSAPAVLNDSGKGECKVSSPGVLVAVWNAFEGKELSYYPRQMGKTLTPDRVLSLINEQLKDMVFDSPDKAKTYIDRAKDSLEEVKKHTEYQDQKVSRLLTIVAFLTAAAGTIFGKIVDTYPLHSYVQTQSVSALLVGSTYVLFAAYLVLVACGALVAFYATQSRFVWPAGHEEATAKSVKSFLFFRSILTTPPEVWGSSFLDASDPKESSNSMLVGYYRNYVAEAYLVACKVGDKLRYLQPAQSLLLTAIRVLLLWFLVSAASFALLQPGATTVEIHRDSNAAVAEKNSASPTAPRSHSLAASTSVSPLPSAAR